MWRVSLSPSLSPSSSKAHKTPPFSPASSLSLLHPLRCVRGSQVLGGRGLCSADFLPAVSQPLFSFLSDFPVVPIEGNLNQTLVLYLRHQTPGCRFLKLILSCTPPFFCKPSFLFALMLTSKLFALCSVRRDNHCFCCRVRVLRVKQEGPAHRGRPGWQDSQVPWDLQDPRAHRAHRDHHTAAVLVL